MLELPQPRPGQSDEPRPAHPYFIGAQFHPELTGRPLRPQPMFMGLVAAAIAQKHGHSAADDPALARWLRTPRAERQPA
jgi:CTP synthase